MKKKILFVCIENSNRSQMAEAFARMLAPEKVDAFSAGSSPSGLVNPLAVRSMAKLHYDLTTHNSKSLEQVSAYAPFDLVVTMGCGDACPWMPATKFIDWDIPDPRGLDDDGFDAVRDLIRDHVAELIRRTV